MDSAKGPVIFQDVFRVTEQDPDGRVYQRVSRVVCVNAAKTARIAVDVNVEEFELENGTELTIALAKTLNLDGSPEPPIYDHSVYHKQTLMSAFDYVTHGKVYQCDAADKSGSSSNVVVYISCGGLLAEIRGSADSLKGVHFNDNVYMLMKRR